MAIKKFLTKCANPRIFAFSLLWLIVLTVVGTLAQSDIGLHRAQMKYFASIYFMWGPVPLPGGTTVLSIVAFGLTCQILFKSPWSKAKSGIFIAHLGSLLLLLGGLLTNLFSFEGNMVIPEGETTDFISSYHDFELAVIDTSPKDHDAVTSFSGPRLAKGEVLKSSDRPFTVKILDFYSNSAPMPLGERPPQQFSHLPRRGFAGRFQLQNLPAHSEEERNRPALIFQVIGAGKDVDGLYSIFLGMPIWQTLTLPQEKKYAFELRPMRTYLPFAITLLDFQKVSYPGTSKAKSYSSKIILHADNRQQKALIEMNAPLRYKGHTLYQASFMQGPNQETTVLAVVHNVGRTFPYIASIIICLGLLLHLLLRSGKLFAPSSRGKN